MLPATTQAREEGSVTDEMVVIRQDDVPRLTLFDGISIKPVIGNAMSIQEVALEPGSIAPVHTHDEEQFGYIVSGTCEFTDGNRHWELEPGDWYHAPSGTPHGARGLSEGCVLIDVFAPPRAQVVQMLADAGK
jgi:quercetin dioxygenase-like cupin family protein